jgi:hypothetical protein
VYYKHELFAEIIDFPPLPISLDYDILGNNADIMNDFEKGNVFTKNEIDNFDERLRVFLDEVEENGEILFELNAIGQLYLISFRLRYSKIVNLEPLDDSKRKEATFRDDHYPNGFKEFVNKVFEENRWIKTCFSLPYNGQAAIKGIGFFVKQSKAEKDILIGTYKKDDFGARFQIILADESRENLNWAAVELNGKYKK